MRSNIVFLFLRFSGVVSAVSGTINDDADVLISPHH